MAVQKSYTKTVTQDYDQNGVPDYTSVEEYTYKKGNLIQYKASVDWSGDSIFDYIIQTDNTYSKGKLVETVNSYDWDAMNGWDQVDTTTYVYDGKDLVAEYFDYLTDGTIDSTTVYDYA